MADNWSRQLETELIGSFLRHSLALLEAGGRPVEELVVADIGCGNGYTLETLLRIDPRPKFIGFEFSPELRELAERRLFGSNVQICSADIRERTTLGRKPID